MKATAAAAGVHKVIASVVLGCASISLENAAVCLHFSPVWSTCSASGQRLALAAILHSLHPLPLRCRRQSLQYPTTPSGGEAPAPPPLLMLMLCRLCQFVEREVLAQVLGRVQELFPERMAGREEPPAFVAGELGRWGGQGLGLCS